MFETSQTTEKLDAALAKMQGEIKAAIKDSLNPHFRSKYADLASVWEAVRAALSKHGISVTQWPLKSDDGKLEILTRIAHSGEWMRATFSIPVTKQDAQGYGSGVTYSRRFTLMAALGVAPGDDDDAEAASGRPALNRVVSEQPEANDGDMERSGYRIPFGKYAKRSLEEVGPDDLRSYIEYLEAKASANGKPLVGVVKEFVERASAHVASFENGPHL